MNLISEDNIKVWYLNIAGSQSGPFSYNEVNKKLKSKNVTYEDYIFKDGMEGWVKIGALPQFGTRTPYISTGITVGSAKIPDIPQKSSKEIIWFYYNLETDEQLGPFSTKEIDSELTSGKFNFNNYIWTESFGDKWKRIAEVPEFDRRNLDKIEKMLPPKITPPANLRDNNESNDSDEELFSSGNSDLLPGADEPHSKYGDEYEPLELTRGAESEFEMEQIDSDSSNITKTALSKDSPSTDFSESSTINEEDCFTGIISDESSQRSFTNADNSGSTATIPNIPEDVEDGAEPLEPSYNYEDDRDVVFENTFSSDVFTESIEGETSCSLVDIDSSTGDDLSEKPSNKKISSDKEKRKNESKDEQKPVKNVTKSKKIIKIILFLALLVVSFDSALYVYKNFHDLKKYIPFDTEKFEKYLPQSIFPSSKPSVILSDDPSSKLVQQKNKIHEEKIKTLSSNKLKDDYILGVIGKDKSLKNPVSKNIIEMSKNYNSNSQDIKILQLVDNSDLNFLKRRAAYFKKVLRANKFSSSLFSKAELMILFGSLYEKQNQDLFALGWYKLALKASLGKSKRARVFENIADIYSAKNDSKAASFYYTQSLKIVKNPKIHLKLKSLKAKGTKEAKTKRK